MPNILTKIVVFRNQSNSKYKNATNYRKLQSLISFENYLLAYVAASRNKLEFLFTREILHLDFTEKLGTSLCQKIMSFHITFAAKNCKCIFFALEKNCVTFAFFVFHKIVKNNVKEKKELFKPCFLTWTYICMHFVNK